MHEFPRLEVTSGQNHVHAQIIGENGLSKRLQLFLRKQEIVVTAVSDPADINLSRRSDFVYWFLAQNSRKIPPVLVNYLKSSQAKLTIILPSDFPDSPDTPDLLPPILDAGIDACRVQVKDIYGPSMADGNLSLIWRDLKTKFVINLPDDDSAEIYPIFIDDAAAAVIKISFSTQTYGRTFFITGSDKTNILSFSYRLREEVVRQTQKLPLINYTQSLLRPSSIVHRPSSINDAASTRAFLNWRPETDLSEGLVKLVNSINLSGRFISRRIEDGIFETIEEEPNKAIFSNKPGGDDELSEDTKPSVSKKSRRGPFGRLIIKKKTTFRFRRGFVFPAALAIAFFAAIISLPRLLDSTAAALAKNSPARLARFERIFAFLGRRSQFEKLRQDALLAAAVGEISHGAGRLILSMLPDSPDSPVEILDQLESDSTRLLKDMPVGERRADLSLARELIPVVRRTLAANRKQTFAVVFQNSAELRPAGGSISSLAFITLQKGKILDIDYQSVDQLDSQLVGAQVPPEPIKNYLGETNWLIRDSNWSADAVQSAQKLQELISRAVGRNLDGVIFLTTPALKRILAQTGEISAWNQFNIADRLVYNNRSDPFISLAQALEQFIKTNPGRRLVIAGILSAVRHNDLLIFSTDSAAAQILNRLQADGAFPPLICPLQLNAQTCLADQIAVVDANLSANKADYFMLKEHDIAVSLSAAKITTALTLRYQNAAASSQYPAGTYRNYVRVYLPPDSVVASVVRLAPDGLVAVPTQNSIESGRKVIGWFLEVPIGGQEVFRLETIRPAKLTPANQVAAYSLVIRKQPGTAVPVSVSIGYPPSLAPLAVSDQVTVTADKLLLNHPGGTNLNLTVEFASDIISP